MTYVPIVVKKLLDHNIHNLPRHHNDLYNRIAFGPLLVISLFRAASSTSLAERPTGNSSLNLTFPLKETGYSTTSSFRQAGSNSGHEEVPTLREFPFNSHSSSARWGQKEPTPDKKYLQFQM